MAILIDADVFIEAERGTFDLTAWLASQPHQEFKMAAITVPELWHGVERATGAHRVKRQRFLEHFSYCCRVSKGSLNQAFASSAVRSGSSSAMAWSSASLVRALAARSSCLSLAQAFSMGFRSGEYGGR